MKKPWKIIPIYWPNVQPFRGISWKSTLTTIVNTLLLVFGTQLLYLLMFCSICRQWMDLIWHSFFSQLDLKLNFPWNSTCDIWGNMHPIVARFDIEILPFLEPKPNVVIFLVIYKCYFSIVDDRSIWQPWKDKMKVFH